jgi:hypothetical protein
VNSSAAASGRRPAASPGPRLLTRLQARGVAESLWGPGGTYDEPTNRAGAFYFDCSGHGGFVIDDRALTGQERRHLTSAGFSADLCRGVRGQDGRIIAVRHPHAAVADTRQVAYRPADGEYVDEQIALWTLEEDAEWAAIYALTGIRMPGRWGDRYTEAEMIEYARESLGRNYPQAARVAAQLAAPDSGSQAQRSAATPPRPRRDSTGRTARPDRRKSP